MYIFNTIILFKLFCQLQFLRITDMEFNISKAVLDRSITQNRVGLAIINVQKNLRMIEFV